MKYIITALLFVLCNDCLAHTIKNPPSCNQVSATKYMIWREAGNQNLDVQILVFRVLQNRVKKFKTDICTELFRKGAYPYMRYGVKSVPKNFNSVYTKVVNSVKYKNTKYFYFNHRPHKFGKNTKKIQGLYFSE